MPALPPRPARGGVGWLLTGLASSGLTAVLVTVVGTTAVPRLIEAYRSFGADVGWGTRLYANTFALVWLLPVLVLAAWWFAPSRVGPRLAALLGMGSLALGAICTVFALYLPYFRLGSIIG